MVLGRQQGAFTKWRIRILFEILFRHCFRFRTLAAKLWNVLIRFGETKLSAFDAINRTDVDLATHSVPAFDYLNSSARPEAVAIRNQVDRMFARYPAQYRAGLEGRFRSRDDVGHKGAFFELLIYEICLNAGYAVLDIESKIENSKQRPDFLLKTPCGSRFYLEATTATGQSDKDAAAERRLNDVIDTINNVSSSNFFLAVRLRGKPKQPLALRNLRESLEGWLAKLDHPANSVGSRADGLYPCWCYEKFGVKFEIEAIPKAPRPKESGRVGAIGLLSLGGGWVTVQESIRKVIRKKANEYKGDLPYVVAVNTLEHSTNGNFLDGLFGNEAVRISTENHEADPELVRQPNGLWYTRQGAANKRVSAVVGASQVCPWSFAQKRCTFIPNPWARQPIELGNLAVDRFQTRNDTLELISGSTIAEILTLPANWPDELETVE